MNDGTILILAQEIYKLFYDLKKSCNTVTVNGMYSLEQVLQQELSECILAIWCSGYIGYKETDYRLIYSSIGRCVYFIGILYDLGKVSSADYQKWNSTFQSILQSLKLILENNSFLLFTDKTKGFCC